MRTRGAASALAIALSIALSACASFHQGPLPGEPPGAKFETIDGARVHYIDVPSRTNPPESTVVLVHGFAASLRTWRDIVPVLSRHHRVVGLDLKGFGWTDRPPGDYSPAAQARLVFGLLDRRGVDRVAVVAHSWGSSVALQMALTEPSRVDRLALYDAWVYEDQLPSTFHFARADGVGEALFSLFYTERQDDKMETAFFDRGYVTEERIEGVEADQARPGAVAAALAATRGQRFADVESRYATIDKPTLLLWGREDRIATLEYGERLAADLPRAKLIVYPRCGHFPMIEAAPASTRDLAAFLRSPNVPVPVPALPSPPPSPPSPSPVHAPPPAPESGTGTGTGTIRETGTDGAP